MVHCLSYVLDIGADTRVTPLSRQWLASLPGPCSSVIVACQIIKYCSQISFQSNQFQPRLRSQQPRTLVVQLT